MDESDFEVSNDAVQRAADLRLSSDVLHELFAQVLLLADPCEDKRERVWIGNDEIEGVRQCVFRVFGTGMDSVELSRFGGRIEKIANRARALPSKNPDTSFCIQMRSCADARAFEAVIVDLDGRYQGLTRRLISGRASDAIDVTDFYSRNSLKSDWIELTLFEQGADAAVSSGGGAAAMAASAANELYRRFYRLPANLDISFGDGSDEIDGLSDFRPIGDAAFDMSDAVDLAGGAVVHYRCRPERAAAGAEDLGGLVFRDQIYDVMTGARWREQLKEMGVENPVGGVSILVELPDDGSILCDAFSGELRRNHGDGTSTIDFGSFQELVRANSPTWLVELTGQGLRDDTSAFDLASDAEAAAPASEGLESPGATDPGGALPLRARRQREDRSQKKRARRKSVADEPAVRQAALELAEIAAAHDKSAFKTQGLKICIVTNELAEFHQNGGLGTANSGLVHALGVRGFTPAVLYTAWIDLQAATTQAAIAALRARGVEFYALQELVPRDWMQTPEKISYACYWFLRDSHYDVVHFNDYMGNGFYAAQARRTGTALRQTTVIVTVHGTTRWAMEIDERPFSNAAEQKVCLLEHKTLEFADAVIGVSHHLIHWLREKGVKLPRHTYVHKNIMPTTMTSSGSGAVGPGELTNIAFFGRHDVRKGFFVMLEAIRLAAPSLPNIKFTFVGKFMRVHGEHSGAVALDELKDVANLIEFRHDYDRDRALQFLSKPGTLVVIPSLDENSPCTVFECIVAGVPFIASEVGGIPELVAPEHREAVLFKANAKALAARLLEVAGNGLSRPSLAFDPAAIEEQMFAGFAAVHEMVSQEFAAQCEAEAENKPLVSVVVTHFNRPAMLKNLLRTLEKQTYENFEVIVVDDGSTHPDAIAYVAELADAKFSYPFTIVPIKNSYLGAARNAGVRHARGVFLKFQDDDNIPFPCELETFVQAALMSKADIVTAMARFFRDEAELGTPLEIEKFEYFPMGASLPASLFRNEYGDANALVRRESFLEDGGFTELYGVGFEDYEFFLKSESLGRKIMLVPEPIFNYRVADGSMLRSTSAYRGAKRVRSGLRVSDQTWLQELIDYTQDIQVGRDIGDQAWWRAGRRRHGQLHQQMMDGDPSSKTNIDRFIDLAVRYERVEDVIHMVLRGNALMNSLQWLESNARDIGRNDRKLLQSRAKIASFERFKDIRLLKPESNLPNFEIFRVEATGILVHPLKDRTVEAQVGLALPPKTKKVSVLFSHRGIRGNPIRAQIAASLEGRVLGVSEWTLVSPGEVAEVVLSLERALALQSNLILRTKVGGAQDFCWVFAEHMRIESLE